METAPESAEQWAHIRVVGPAGSLEFDLPIKREPTHDPAGNTRVLDHGPGLTAVNLVQTEVYGGSVRILGARADRLLLEVYYYEDATNNTGVDTVTQQVAVPIGEPSELRIHKKVRVEVRYTTPQR